MAEAPDAVGAAKCNDCRLMVLFRAICAYLVTCMNWICGSKVEQSDHPVTREEMDAMMGGGLNEAWRCFLAGTFPTKLPWCIARQLSKLLRFVNFGRTFRMLARGVATLW
eukprot:s1251_g26.t1